MYMIVQCSSHLVYVLHVVSRSPLNCTRTHMHIHTHTHTRTHTHTHTHTQSGSGDGSSGGSLFGDSEEDEEEEGEEEGSGSETETERDREEGAESTSGEDLEEEVSGCSHTHDGCVLMVCSVFTSHTVALRVLYVPHLLQLQYLSCNQVGFEPTILCIRVFYIIHVPLSYRGSSAG